MEIDRYCLLPIPFFTDDYKTILHFIRLAYRKFIDPYRLPDPQVECGITGLYFKSDRIIVRVCCNFSYSDMFPLPVSTKLTRTEYGCSKPLFIFHPHTMDIIRSDPAGIGRTTDCGILVYG